MAQALLNNLNINQDFTPQTTNVNESACADFQNVLNKMEVKNNDSVSGTLGAMKYSENNSSFAKLDDILSQVTTELAEESALDLTLEKDVEEVVSETPDEETLPPENIVMPMCIEQKTENISVDNTVEDTVSLDTQTDDSLNVTLNGTSLDQILENFNLSASAEEVEIVKPEIKTEPESKSIEDLVDEDVLKELNIESIEAEAGENTDSSDLMQNQTPEEQGIKAMLQTEASEFKLTEEVSAPKQTEVSSNNGKIIEQVSKQMDKLFNGSKLEMIMNPESLGKLSIQLVNTKDGLTAQFTVATQEARNIIMKGLEGLKETLASHGVNVDNVSVKLSEAQEGEYNPDWTEQEGSNGGNKQQRQNRGQKDKENFEEMMSFEQEEN